MRRHVLDAMLKPVRRILPPAARRRLKVALGRPTTRLHPDWQLLEPIGPVRRPHVVLDVGSANGWFFHCWKDWCPEAEVHAFEPARESYERSLELYGSDPQIRVSCVGVGDCGGERELHMLGGSPASNSFLTPDLDTWNQIRFETGTVVTRRVPITTLDDYCLRERIGEIHLLTLVQIGVESG
jgi:FkbM family methyltransferase